MNQKETLNMKKVTHMICLLAIFALTLTFLYGCHRGTLVTFHTYGGTEIGEQRITSLDDIEDPVKSGYQFDGWYRYSNYSGNQVEELPNEKKISLHAKWTIKEYVINYGLNGGEGLSSSTFTVDSNFDLQIPFREGFIFDGWYRSSDFTGDMVSKLSSGTTGDLSLYALWTEISSSGIRYELVESKDAYRVINLTNPVEHLIIPSTHQGLPVVEILFKGTILPSVRRTLKSIQLPHSIIRIENIAHPYISLGYFNNLTDFHVSPNNETYMSMDGILYSKDQKTLYSYPAGRTADSYLVEDFVEVIYDHAFFANRYLKSLEIPSSVKSIGDYAFAYNFALEEIIFSEESNLESIGKSAFMQVWMLEDIIIPNSVIEIKEDAFSYMTSLTSITVLEGNEAYTSIDGVLYTKDLSNLIKYPAKKTNPIYALPEEVLVISSLAFEYATYLTKITISKNVEVISRQAFYGASQLSEVIFEENSQLKRVDAESFFGTNLTEIILPETLESIGNAAFRSNQYLESITILSIEMVKLGVEVFDFTHEDLKIYVLSDLILAYQEAANWKFHKEKLISIH